MKHEIQFSGHKNIRSLHQKTIEITKDSSLTVNGDCIVGVNASHACDDLPIELKNKLQDSKCKVKFSLKVGDYVFTVHGKGSPDLVLNHKTDIVIRKSSFTCPRTLAIQCDKASDVIPREIITMLQDPKTKGLLIIEV
ncbi:MAG: DUF371 domain-containing protein [Nitrosopumilaceae archaeon]|nr:DUF371 domain-containing protein [Nitrosopumilaceae archaeon]